MSSQSVISVCQVYKYIDQARFIETLQNIAPPPVVEYTHVSSENTPGYLASEDNEGVFGMLDKKLEEARVVVMEKAKQRFVNNRVNAASRDVNQAR